MELQIGPGSSEAAFPFFGFFRSVLVIQKLVEIEREAFKKRFLGGKPCARAAFVASRLLRAGLGQRQSV